MLNILAIPNLNGRYMLTPTFSIILFFSFFLACRRESRLFLSTAHRRRRCRLTLREFAWSSPLLSYPWVTVHLPADEPLDRVSSQAEVQPRSQTVQASANGIPDGAGAVLCSASSVTASETGIDSNAADQRAQAYVVRTYNCDEFCSIITDTHLLPISYDTRWCYTAATDGWSPTWRRILGRKR
jgi:hypothetical protein